MTELSVVGKATLPAWLDQHADARHPRDCVLERFWRDARVNRLYEGTTQIQKLIIGRFTTGIDAIG